MQVVVDGSEESALACFWVTDGIDWCRVGFLPRHYFKHWQDFEGRLAQVVELYKDSDSKEKRKKHYRNSGCCQAVLIDTMNLVMMPTTTYSPLPSGEKSVKQLQMALQVK